MSLISSSIRYILPRDFSNSELFMDKPLSIYPYVKLNRDANCFLPVKMHKFFFISVEKYVGKKRGTIHSHWNTNYLLENLSSKNHENGVSSEYLLLESECSLTRYASSWSDTRHLYLWLQFLKIKKLRITLAILLIILSWLIVV